VLAKCRFPTRFRPHPYSDTPDGFAGVLRGSRQPYADATRVFDRPSRRRLGPPSARHRRALGPPGKHRATLATNADDKLAYVPPRATNAGDNGVYPIPNAPKSSKLGATCVWPVHGSPIRDVSGAWGVLERGITRFITRTNVFIPCQSHHAGHDQRPPRVSNSLRGTFGKPPEDSPWNRCPP
jgi:hypothetical protein